MSATVEFARMNGLGNKILVVDMRGRPDKVTPAAAVALNADPQTEFDQIMAIHDPKAEGTDAFIDILNSDGSKAQACGNGTRCVVQALAAETGRKVFTFQTVAGILNAVEHEDGTISVDMGRPVFDWDRIPLAEEFHDTSRIELQIGPIDKPVLHSPSAMSMGNPH
ncbi:diaminopimelate epimerase, partial [Rhizobium ruizarguesonis]